MKDLFIYETITLRDNLGRQVYWNRAISGSRPDGNELAEFVGSKLVAFGVGGGFMRESVMFPIIAKTPSEAFEQYAKAESVGCVDAECRAQQRFFDRKLTGA